MKVKKLFLDISEWRHNITCYHCKSELEINYKDIFHSGEEGNWHENGWDYYWANCCICGQRYNFDEADLPNLIAVAVKQRNKNKWLWWLYTFVR